MEPVLQNMGGGGQYDASILWTNVVGDARDVIFELTWAGAFKTALNGVFIDVQPFGT